MHSWFSVIVHLHWVWTFQAAVDMITVIQLKFNNV